MAAILLLKTTIRELHSGVAGLQTLPLYSARPTDEYAVASGLGAA
jgi:hypothetical protein